MSAWLNVALQGLVSITMLRQHTWKPKHQDAHQLWSTSPGRFPAHPGLAETTPHLSLSHSHPSTSRFCTSVNSALQTPALWASTTVPVPPREKLRHRAETVIHQSQELNPDTQTPHPALEHPDHPSPPKVPPIQQLPRHWPSGVHSLQGRGLGMQAEAD